MRIDVRQQPRELRPDVRGPTVRVGEEETLLRREAVNRRRARLAFHRLLPRGISDDQTAQVCDRLADYQFAVLVQARLDLEAVELVDDALGARMEILKIGVRKPVLQITCRIELRALIVEAVRHL